MSNIILSNHQVAILNKVNELGERFARFLGIIHMHKRSPLRKLVVQPYRDIITNYAQLSSLTADIEQEMNLQPLQCFS